MGTYALGGIRATIWLADSTLWPILGLSGHR
jgi:hypothetical protein